MLVKSNNFFDVLPHTIVNIVNGNIVNGGGGKIKLKYSTACHKLFFRGWEKAATYGRIGILWQAAATYDLPTMISEN